MAEKKPRPYSEIHAETMERARQFKLSGKKSVLNTLVKSKALKKKTKEVHLNPSDFSKHNASAIRMKHLKVHPFHYGEKKKDQFGDGKGDY